MEARRYNPEADFVQLANWAAARKSTVESELLPPIGFIVDGVAAYFLYETPSRVCFLESMLSNPEADSATRDGALNALTTAILSEAKDRGFRVAYACTDVPAVVERAIRSGATFKPRYVLLQKAL